MLLRIAGSAACALIFVVVLLFVVSTCVDVANSEEIEWTEQERIEFRIQFCQDSVHYYYFSRTGIELDFIETNYTEDGAPIVGVADSDDERFTGPVYFKCSYGEVEGIEVITDIEVKQ